MSKALKILALPRGCVCVCDLCQDPPQRKSGHVQFQGSWGILRIFFCQNVASLIYALLSSYPPECKDWGTGRGGQANLGNARILRAFDTVT